MSPGPPRADSLVILLSVLVAAGGFLLHGALGPPDTFWTIDNGGKALVLANLREDPGRSWIEYPGQAIDPELRWFPQPLDGAERYGVRQGGHVVSQYLSPFVWLTLPFAGLGFRGLVVLPALAAGAAVFLTGRIAAGRSGPGAGRAAAAVLALASPLLFYASVFWEHTLVTALAAGAFLAIGGDRPRPLVGGLLVGCAGLLREECFLLAAAMAAALWITGRRRDVPRFAAGAGVGLLALLAFQKAQTGSWTGVHVGVNRPMPFRHSLTAVRGLLLGTGFSGASVATVAVALSILLAGRRLHALGATALGALALGVVALLALIRFPGGGDEALAIIHSNSAVLFVPWALAVPFLRRPAAPAGRELLLWAPLLFVAAFLVLVPERSITGIHPGPRMLLPALPALAVLAAERFPRTRIVAGALLLTLVAGTAWTVQSLRLLHDKRHASAALAEAIASDPRRVVATNLFWLPTELCSLWDRKQFHLVSGPDDLAALGARAAAAGDSEILVVAAPGASGAIRTIAHPRLPAFAAALHVRPASPETAP